MRTRLTATLARVVALVLLAAADAPVARGAGPGAIGLEGDPLERFSSPARIFLRHFLTELQNDGSTARECRRDMDKAMAGSRQGQDWAMRLFDSIGKPGSGQLEGGVNFPGYFTECVEIRSEDNIRGKYCLVRIKFKKDTEAVQHNRSIVNVPPWDFSVAVCVPSSCAQQDVDQAVQTAAVLLDENAEASADECYVDIEEFTPDIASCFVIWLFASSVLLAIVGTVLDARLRNCPRDHRARNPGSRAGSGNEAPCNGSVAAASSTSSSNSASSSSSEALCKEKKATDGLLIGFFRSFSVASNARKILAPASTEGALGALHGIRFLSMAWIIVGHTFFFAQKWLFFRNPETMTAVTKHILSQAFANGTFAVDTFFFLSGFLVTHTMLRRLKQTDGRFNLLHFYLHRYLRMTPVMMAIIAFSANFLKYLGSGPSWRQATVMYDDWCRENWWINALYIQNFVHRDHMCLSHTWYSAVDMQFYLVSPLIIYLCYRHKYWAVPALLIPFFVTSICPLVYTITYHLPAIPSDTVPVSVMNEYYAFIYIKPYCRMGPYIVGIALAHFLYKKNASFRLSKGHQIVGWTVAIAVNVGVICSMTRVFRSGSPPTDAEAAVYNGFARTAWAVTVGWITLTCISGHTGLLNRILSSQITIPLSRLTYSAYLVHPVLMAMYYGSREAVFDFSLCWLVYMFIGNLVITYVVSFVLSIFFELPVMNIEKLLRER